VLLRGKLSSEAKLWTWNTALGVPGWEPTELAMAYAEIQDGWRSWGKLEGSGVSHDRFSRQSLVGPESTNAVIPQPLNFPSAPSLAGANTGPMRSSSWQGSSGTLLFARFAGHNPPRGRRSSKLKNSCFDIRARDLLLRLPRTPLPYDLQGDAAKRFMTLKRSISSRTDRLCAARRSSMAGLRRLLMLKTDPHCPTRATPAAFTKP